MTRKMRNKLIRLRLKSLLKTVFELERRLKIEMENILEGPRLVSDIYMFKRRLRAKNDCQGFSPTKEAKLKM